MNKYYALFLCAFVPLCLLPSPLPAQQRGQRGAAPAGFPALFFSEAWQREEGARGQTPVDPLKAVSSPNLELRVYGPDKANLNISGNTGNETGPINLWTGLNTGPVAATLRNKSSYVDLTGLAKMRWIIRTSGFHQVRPVVKLADGTMLVGDHADSSTTSFMQIEFAFLGIRWAKLDPDRIVTIGSYGQSQEASVIVTTVDLSKVDEVGFADLMPSGGHGAGAWANVARIEVFGKAVPRN